MQTLFFYLSISIGSREGGRDVVKGVHAADQRIHARAKLIHWISSTSHSRIVSCNVEPTLKDF